MSICRNNIYFPVKLLKVDLWQMSNGKKSLVLAGCNAYADIY